MSKKGQQELKEIRNFKKQPRMICEDWTAEDSDAYGLGNFEPSRTKQADAQSCDINYIMERFAVTGQLPVNTNPGMYEDFSDVGSFQEAMQIVAQANSQFMGLDARVRERFNNDPAQFLAYMENPDKEELKKMGLLVESPIEASDVSVAQAEKSKESSGPSSEGKR